MKELGGQHALCLGPAAIEKALHPATIVFRRVRLSSILKRPFAPDMENNGSESPQGRLKAAMRLT